MTDITEAMLEAGREALEQHTSRFLDGAEVVEDGAIEAIFHAMMAARIRAAPDTGMVTLADCPPGLFLTADGHLGLKTEYGAMETVGPTNVPGSEVRWVVGREPEAYVAASGEYFWGGASTHEKRREVMVKPIDVADLNLGVGYQDDENPWRSQAEWSALVNGRDNFIVNEGLWSAFCDYLEKTA